MQNAIDREKQLKQWHRDWKWDLVKSFNPELKDLSKPWFEKEDLEDILEFRLSNESRFNDYQALEKFDPESSSG